MDEFREWLSDEPSGSEYWPFIRKALILKMAVAVVCVLIASVLTPIGPVDGAQEILDLMARAPWLLAVAAGLEEVIFRLPLAIPLVLFGLGRVTLVSALVVSFAFGAAHGPWHFLVQGPVGLVLVVVFFKCGAIRGRWGILKGLYSSTLVHTLYNAIFMAFALIPRWLGLGSGL